MDPGTWHFEATAAGPGWVVGGARVGRNSRVSLESGLDAMCDPPTPPVPLLPHYGPSSRPSRRAGPRRRRSSVSSKTVIVAVPRPVTKCQINKNWPRRSSNDSRRRCAPRGRSYRRPLGEIASCSATASHHRTASWRKKYIEMRPTPLLR